MDQYIGKLLDNRYELLERIGKGGMAVVYKARCHRLNRLVAVKILKPDLANDAEFRRRFHDESQAVAMLSHPNIMAVYDVSRSQDLDYIVMELLDGITLKQYMYKRGVPLNWRESLHFTIQIIKALGHAHSRGIIHRDIKPHNIMVLRDGSIKVADFGIARLVGAGQSTLTQEALGSVHYISPEQARGSRIDGRADIYSAGVVLYEMITGRLPFEGETPVSVAIQHINSIPIPPRELNPDIPEALEAIILKAMAPNVEQRYASADNMLADLEEFRKNPNISFEYIPTDFQGEEVSEPTQVVSTSQIRAESDDSIHRRRKQRTKPEIEQEYEERRQSVAPTLAALSVILLFIIGVFVFLWNSFFNPLFTQPVTYEVPNLLGMTISEILADSSVMKDFQILEGEPSYDENYELGEVVRQSPVAGTTVKDGNQTITISINTKDEADELRMPNIINWDQRQALKLLQDEMGFTVDQTYEASDTVNEGYVIRSTPIEGTICKPGDKVSIVISQGPKVETCTVPTVEGMTLEEAVEALRSFDLEVGDVNEIHSETVEAGLVVLQSIKASTEVPVGSTVNLQISLGSANPQIPGSGIPPNDDAQESPDSSEGLPVVVPIKDINFNLSGYSGTIHLKVVVGNTVVMDGQVDTAIGMWSCPVAMSGSQEVSYYVNGAWVRTDTVDFSS